MQNRYGSPQTLELIVFFVGLIFTFLQVFFPEIRAAGEAKAKVLDKDEDVSTNVDTHA